MAYPIVADPVFAATTAAIARLNKLERDAMRHLGQDLDASFLAVWRPAAPATVEGIAEACGTNFLARLETHAALATVLLAQESANGIDSSQHPWAVKQPYGGYQPGIPAGWSYTPVLDPNGTPTGAATVSYVKPG